MDDLGHGTHCAGTIAAIANNNKGIAGVAPKAKIMGVKALNSSGSGTWAWLADGIVYAVDKGANVISNSWGCYQLCPHVPVVEAAVSYAYSRGVVVVFAAGNSNIDVRLTSPQNMGEQVITVASIDHLGNKSSFSSWGPLVDIAAPGGDSAGLDGTNRLGRNILSLRSNNNGHPTDMYTDGLCIVGSDAKYYRSRGTSMACPHAAGVAALMLGKNHSLSPLDVSNLMKAGATPLPRHTFVPIGAGILNARDWSSASPLASVVSFKLSSPYPFIVVNEETDLNFKLILNNLTAPFSVTLTSSDPNIQIIQGQSQFAADVEPNTANNDASPFRFKYTGQNSIGQELHFNLHFEGTALDLPFLLYTPVNNLSDSVESLPGWPKTAGAAYTGFPSVADFDGDGQMEIVVSSSNGTVTAYHSNGTPVSGWPVQSDCQTGCNGTATVADIDGDGTPEILYAGKSSTQFYVWRTNGTLMPGWPKSAGFEIPAIADVDKDGKSDIILGGEVLRYDGPRIGASGLWNAVVVDFDGDGELDFVSDAGEWLYARHLDGTELPNWPVFPNEFEDRLGSSAGRPAVGDLDGDGMMEMIATTQNFDSVTGNLSSALEGWHADGTRMQNWPIEGGITNPYFTSPILADLDGNGTLEIIAGGYDHKVYAWYYNGSPVPGWPVLTGDKVSTPPAAADIDGDGHSEILVASKDSRVYIWHGDGTLVAPWPIYTMGSSITPVVADLNGDGKLEVIEVATLPGGQGRIYAWTLPWTVADTPAKRMPWPMHQHDLQRTGHYPLVPPAPQAPFDLMAAPLAASDIILNWIDDSSNESGFKIYRSSDGVNFSPLANVGENVTEYQSSHLDAGKKYYFRVRAFNTGGQSPDSNTALASTPDTEAAVSLFTAIPLSISQVHLSWFEASNKAVHMIVERSMDGTSFSQVADITNHSNLYDDSGLEAGTLYYYRIKAVDAGGHFNYSDVIQVSTRDHLAAPTLLLDPHRSVLSSELNLSWTDASFGVQSYSIERSTDNVNFTQIANIGYANRYYYDQSVTPDTIFFYRIKSINAVESSAYSSTVTAHTPKAGDPVTPCIKDFVIDGLDPHTLRIFYDGTPTAGHKVEMSTDNVNFVEISAPAGVLFGLDSNMPYNVTHYYRVKEYIGAKESPYSAVVSSAIGAGPIAAPSGLSGVALNNTEVTVTWQDNSSNEDGFTVELSYDGSFVNPLYTIYYTMPANQTSFLLQEGTVRVRAFNSDSFSAYSNTITVKAGPPTPPSQASAVSGSATRADIVWADNSPNEMGFKIERSTDNQNFSVIGQVGANNRLYRDQGLTPNTFYYYKIKAYNAAGESGYSNVASTQTGSPVVNRPPVLNPIGPKSVNEGSALSFVLSASDPDGDSLTYSASNLPQGATFDTATKTFSWTPGYDKAGAYPGVLFKVQDPAGLEASEAVTITVVNVNRAPVVSTKSPNQSTLTMMPNGMQNFGVTVTDPDNDSLSKVWKLDGNLIAGANTSYYTFSAQNLQGTHVVSFDATDPSGAKASVQWTVNIQAPPTPTLIKNPSSSPLSVPKNYPLQLSVNIQGSPQQSYTFRWKKDNVVVSTVPNAYYSSYNASFTASGSHNVTVELLSTQGQVLTQASWVVNVT